jgi:hypothetical protein
MVSDSLSIGSFLKLAGLVQVFGATPHAPLLRLNSYSVEIGQEGVFMSKEHVILPF